MCCGGFGNREGRQAELGSTMSERTLVASRSPLCTQSLPAPLPAGVESPMTAHTADAGLHELHGELLHRHQGDAVLWAEGWYMLLFPGQPRPAVDGRVTQFRSQESIESLLSSAWRPDLGAELLTDSGACFPSVYSVSIHPSLSWAPSAQRPRTGPDLHTSRQRQTAVSRDTLHCSTTPEAALGPTGSALLHTYLKYGGRTGSRCFTRKKLACSAVSRTLASESRWKVAR